MSQHQQHEPQPQPNKPEKSTDPSLKRPSERNIRIYEAVRIGLRSQRVVAAEFDISQPRVSQILRAVTPFFDGLFPGDELGQRLKEAKRSQRLDWECYERRKKHYRQVEMGFEQSLRPLVHKQWTYIGTGTEKKLVKTVITERDQRISLESVKVQERINDKIERSGWGRSASGVPRDGVQASEAPIGGRGVGRGNVGRQDTLTTGQGFDSGQGFDGAPLEKLPLPEGLREEDQPYWPKLMRDEQELALVRLKLYPGISLHHASVPPGPLWSYFPWRTEAEHNASLQAARVVSGDLTIEEYWQRLEILELSKPFAHPNLLTKDRQGRWQLLDPRQVPLPVMTDERAAWPAESPERIYWPYQSRAEHYAMLRAEMVLKGHLSPDQYDRLNAWASWTMNEKYPDPLEKVVKNIIAPREGAPREGKAPAELSREGEAVVAEKRAEPPRDEVPASKAPTSGRGVESADVPCSSTLTTGQGFDSGGPTRLERLLASGRGLPASQRRRLEGRAARQREQRERAPAATSSG